MFFLLLFKKTIFQFIGVIVCLIFLLFNFFLSKSHFKKNVFDLIKLKLVSILFKFFFLYNDFNLNNFISNLLLSISNLFKVFLYLNKFFL